MRTLSISISKSKQNKLANCHNYFSVCQVESLRALAVAAISSVWSPCRWSGRRLQKNYTGCDVAVWDFDDGPTLIDMAVELKKFGCAWFLATTKSHQKAKGKHPPRDRFRLVMPTEVAFSPDPVVYAEQMRFAHALFGGADKTCREPGRFYFPAVKIIDGADTGKYYRPAHVRSRETIDSDRNRYIQKVNCHIKLGILPKRVRNFLDFGSTWNGRRIAIYHSAAALTAAGIPEGNIEQLILAAPFDRRPIDNEPLTETEVIRNVRNGIKAARAERK